MYGNGKFQRTMMVFMSIFAFPLFILVDIEEIYEYKEKYKVMKEDKLWWEKRTKELSIEVAKLKKKLKQEQVKSK